MKCRALIVDDDDSIRESVGDIVMSLGHEFECAGSQNAARRLLEDREFSYVLLDLEIPVRDDGGFARRENGENLLAEIRSRPTTVDMPVIVMTAHGTDGPDLGVKQMKLGANDFVNKPFEGGNLDAAIREAVGKRPNSNGHSRHTIVEPKPEGPPRPFAGGLLALHVQRVELGGVTILEKSARGHAWRIIELLAEKNDAGKYRSFSGQQLAEKLGRRVGQNAVSQCIRALRKRIASALYDQLNVECGDRDVIESGGRGYRLKEWIEVRRGEGAGSSVNLDPGDNRRDMGGDPGDTNVDPGVNERQRWILDQLRDGAKLRRGDVEKQFKCSAKTAKRDLAELRERGVVHFVAKPWPGYYQLDAAIGCPQARFGAGQLEARG